MIHRSHRTLVLGFFLEGGIPRGKTGSVKFRKSGDRPYLTMNWAAGFSFHRCHADRNVPVDPNLKFIFTGEEVNREEKWRAEPQKGNPL